MTSLLYYQKIKSSSYSLKYPFWRHEEAVPISETLRQGPHIKVATVASRWERVGDLIGSGFEPHISRTKDRQMSYNLCHLAGSLWKGSKIEKPSYDI